MLWWWGASHSTTTGSQQLLQLKALHRVRACVRRRGCATAATATGADGLRCAA
jgi:hypothetical protein